MSTGMGSSQVPLSEKLFSSKKPKRQPQEFQRPHLFSKYHLSAIVATTRRLPSDSGAFADWVASSSAGDLSLGFNAGPSSAPPNANPGGMWSNATAARHINCGLPPEFFFVAPASSFHHPDATTTINFDPHSLNVGVIPLLAAAQPDEEAMRSRGGMQLWQPQQVHNSSKKHFDHGGSSSSGTATCQDCGNQAKKDCSHRRCRTCCKSRGYDCATHVKSTWVPAARRRERQLMGGGNTASSQSTSGAKKPRVAGASQTTTTASHTSTSNTTPPRSFDTSSSHQDASFKDSLPGQVRAPAVFKCVRVTALDDGDDEYAYQAVVRIGGHIFKGFLYDQGFEGREGFPNISELHLGGGGRNAPAVLDPSDIYATSTALLGGSTYANQIN